MILHMQALRTLGILLFTCLILIIPNTRLTAQSSDQVFAAIEEAIQKGDAQALSKHFHTHVDITIGDKDVPYTSSQAFYVVREFFMNYHVRSFRIVHKGSSGNTFYAIGDYYSTRGKFDANIFLKKVNNTYKIEQLRFEQDQ